MEQEYGAFLSWFSRAVIMFLSALLIFWFVVFWLTWTVDKMVMSKAMSDVVEMMVEKGSITEDEVLNCVQERFGDNGTIVPGSLQITESNLTPLYIGDPTYVDVTCKVVVMTREINLAGHADFPNSVKYNGGHTERGYLTINQASPATS